MKQLQLTFGIISLLILFSSCDPNAGVTDLTTNIVGVYEGTVTLNLDTDSIRDIANQRLQISRVSDDTIRIEMLTYPDSSPVGQEVLTASIIRTPYGFIQTDGVMLTIHRQEYSFGTIDGTIEGTPYLIAQGGQYREDGSFEDISGDLVFALQIFKNGVDHYELFQGSKQ